MSDEASEAVSEFYTDLRQKQGKEDALPVTVRTLETIIRLSVAVGKARLAQGSPRHSFDKVSSAMLGQAWYSFMLVRLTLGKLRLNMTAQMRRASMLWNLLALAPHLLSSHAGACAQRVCSSHAALRTISAQETLASILLLLEPLQSSLLYVDHEGHHKEGSPSSTGLLQR